MRYRAIFFAALLGVSLTSEVALAGEKAGEKKGLKVELTEQQLDAVTAAGAVNLPQLSSRINQINDLLITHAFITSIRLAGIAKNKFRLEEFASAAGIIIRPLMPPPSAMK